MSARFVGVVDIARSVARVAVVDLDHMVEVESRKTINQLLDAPPYPHFDVEALWSFIVDSLAELNQGHALDAVCVTTFGSCAALVDDRRAGAPVLDYEYAGPDASRTTTTGSARVHRDFAPAQAAQSGRAALLAAAGLPAELAACADPAHPSTGLPHRPPCSEITSRLPHRPVERRDDPIPRSSSGRAGSTDARGAAGLGGAGRVTPELGQRIGLKPNTPVHVGIHAQNADLLPHLIAREAPFAVVATGPRVNVYAPGGSVGGLDPSRDSLVYLDAFGRPVPAARFMGGQEYKQLIGEQAPAHVGEAAIARVLEEPILLLPSVTEGSGPFPRRRAH